MLKIRIDLHKYAKIFYSVNIFYYISTVKQQQDDQQLR